MAFAKPPGLPQASRLPYQSALLAVAEQVTCKGMAFRRWAAAALAASRKYRQSSCSHCRHTDSSTHASHGLRPLPIYDVPMTTPDLKSISLTAPLHSTVPSQPAWVLSIAICDTAAVSICVSGRLAVCAAHAHVVCCSHLKQFHPLIDWWLPGGPAPASHISIGFGLQLQYTHCFSTLLQAGLQAV